MSRSGYIARVRRRYGSGLLLVPAVAAVIHDPAGRILLQRRSDGQWSLPAGAIEPGESPLEALTREVAEETGLTVVSQRLLDVFGGARFRHTYPNGDEVEYLVALYRCEVGMPGAGPTDPETTALGWFASEEMPRLALPYPRGALFG